MSSDLSPDATDADAPDAACEAAYVVTRGNPSDKQVHAITEVFDDIAAAQRAARTVQRSTRGFYGLPSNGLDIAGRESRGNACDNPSSFRNPSLPIAASDERAHIPRRRSGRSNAGRADLSRSTD